MARGVLSPKVYSEYTWFSIPSNVDEPREFPIFSDPVLSILEIPFYTAPVQ